MGRGGISVLYWTDSELSVRDRAGKKRFGTRKIPYQANLENDIGSIDATGGKDESMKHRGTFTAADGTTHTVTANSENEFAQRVYNLVLSMQANPAPAQAGPVMTVEQFALNWLESQKISCQKSGWADKQEIHLKHMLPLIGQCDIKNIKNTDIRSAVSKLRKEDGTPYSKSYYSAIMGTVGTMFNQAVADGIIPFNPIRNGKRIKNPGVAVHTAEEQRLTDTEVSKIFAEILPKIPPEEKMVRLFLACASTMGLRRQEWAGLTWENVVDLYGDNPRFHIVQKVVYNGEAGNIGELQPGAKTDSGIRWESIPSIALPYVQAAMPNDGQGFLLRGERYNPDGKMWISENAFDWLTRKATSYLPEETRNRIRKFTAHKGRRTFTDVGRRAGVSSLVIGANAGHSPGDIQAVTESVYMHASEDDKAQGMQKISDYITALVDKQS